MFTKQSVIRHAIGTDQAVTLTLYDSGAVIDFSKYENSSPVSTITLHIGKLGGTSLLTVTPTFPTVATGIVSFTLADTDFSSIAAGEYVWWVAASLSAGDDSPPATLLGDKLLASGRFILYAPDQSDTTP